MLNIVILDFLMNDKDGEFFDVTDEFGRDNLESRLKEWYNKYLPDTEHPIPGLGKKEYYKPGLKIWQKGNHLSRVMNIKTNMEILYDYPDHDLYVIKDKRYELDSYTHRKVVKFSKTMDREFIEPYKQIWVDRVTGGPIIKADVVAKPRDK